MEQKASPPNYREIDFPDCCGVCVFYVPAVVDTTYEFLPETCEKFDRASFSWLCDEFIREVDQ